MTVDATPSASHPDSSEATTGASDSESPAVRGGPAGAMSEIVDIFVPQTEREDC